MCVFNFFRHKANWPILKVNSDPKKTHPLGGDAGPIKCATPPRKCRSSENQSPRATQQTPITMNILR